MIGVSIGRTRHKMVVLEHKALAEHGAELVELRLDWLSRHPDLPRLLNERPTPCVVTCRRKTDRGRWKWTEDQRLAILRAAIVAGVEYVDLEDDIAAGIPRYGETKRIVSHHNFDETPADLANIHKKLCKLDPDIVKIVTMANSPSDIVRMLQVVDNAEVPTVGFCMGEFGIASRILCAKYGVPFTYASFSREREMAPGQISFDDMREMYRFDSINAETKVFGVLGDPIAQSHSPLVHNAAFAEKEINAVYLPFRVPADSLKETLNQFRWLDVRGYSVTIPHKLEIAKVSAESDETVSEIGAANTLYKNDTGKWQTANTDYQAALESIRSGLEPGEQLAGKTVMILGSGGVARAIGLGLTKSNCDLMVTNRTSARAEALAGELGCRHVKWENRGAEFVDILINCTPLGMHPNTIDETPFAINWFRDGMLVFDTVYNPENTLFLKEARQRGCRTVSGIEMFVRQAAEQFERFTGEPSPLESMREALRQGISAVRR